MKGNEDSLRDLWDTIKCTIIYILGVSEGEEREKMFEVIIAKNFSNRGRERVNQVQEAQSVSGRNPRRNTPSHKIIKVSKVKDKIFKIAREDSK